MKAAVLLALALFTVALIGTTALARLRAPAPAVEAPATPTPAVAVSVTPRPSATSPPATAGTPASGSPTSTRPQPTAPAATPLTGLTYAAVAQHSAPADCWLVISNRVYDVTSYLKKHPGGAETITPWCGKESTVAFQTEDGAGSHSSRAYRDLETYNIGDLVR